MSITEVLVIIVALTLVLAVVLAAALAIGWTIARLRIWNAEARFVETQSRPASGSEGNDA